MRGENASPGVLYTLRCDEVAKTGPPTGLNALAGSPGCGLAVYAACAAAVMPLGEVPSKPTSVRLCCSTVPVSRS